MKIIQIIIILILQLLLINNVKSDIQLSDLINNKITNLVSGNKTTFSISLIAGKSFLDYTETIYFRDSGVSCTTQSKDISIIMIYCDGINILLPNQYLQLEFDIKSGGSKGTVISIPLILVTIDSYKQERQFLKIQGKGFNSWSQKDKVQVLNTNPILELQVLSIDDEMVNISLSNVPASTTGIFKLSYLNQEVLSFSVYLYPQIISVTPSGIINEQVDLVIKGIFFIGYSYSKLTFDGPDDNPPVTYDLDSDFQITVKYQNLNAYYGEIIANYQQTVQQLGTIQQNTPSPFNTPLYFAKSKINSIFVDQQSNEIILVGSFIDTKLFMDPIIYKLNGYSNASMTTLNYSNNTIIFSLDNIRVYYGTFFELVIDTTPTKNTFTTFAPQLLKIDKAVSRSDKIIYFSGQYLEMISGDGIALYEMYLHIVSNNTDIPCGEFGEVSFNSFGHYYNMYCKFTIDIYPMVTHLLIKPLVGLPVELSLQYDRMTIDSVTSTVYGIPDQLVTITGKSIAFVKIITIGGVNCTNVIFKLVENRGQTTIETLECLFISNVGNLNSELQVVLIDHVMDTVNYNSFLYNIDKPCPTNSKNGLICSGSTNGECIATSRECKCYTGFGGFDCSIMLTNTNPNPTINKTITIIETATSKFEIGLIQIREIEPINNNNVYKSIDLKKQVWDLSSTSYLNSNFTSYTYNTTTNDNCLINVIISIYNSSSTTTSTSNYQQYNFFGDIINIIPNSVKYNIEISNWKFNSKLNAIQVIFESQIVNECKQEEIENNIQKNGESIRSIQMKLKNGDYLVGTFSNRVKVDDRVILSKIEILSNDNFINNDNQNNNLLIQSITVGHFENKTIIDPSFGVLLSSSSNNDNGNNCDNDNRSKWVLIVAIVVPVVGVAILIIAVAIIYKKSTTLKIIGHKLKKIKK